MTQWTSTGLSREWVRMSLIDKYFSPTITKKFPDDEDLKEIERIVNYIFRGE